MLLAAAQREPEEGVSAPALQLHLALGAWSPTTAALPPIPSLLPPFLVHLNLVSGLSLVQLIPG